VSLWFIYLENTTETQRHRACTEKNVKADLASELTTSYLGEAYSTISANLAADFLP